MNTLILTKIYSESRASSSNVVLFDILVHIYEEQFCFSTIIEYWSSKLWVIPAFTRHDNFTTPCLIAITKSILPLYLTTTEHSRWRTSYPLCLLYLSLIKFNTLLSFLITREENFSDIHYIFIVSIFMFLSLFAVWKINMKTNWPSACTFENGAKNVPVCWQLPLNISHKAAQPLNYRGINLHTGIMFLITQLKSWW